MTQPDNTSWPGWILAALTGIGGLYAMLRHFFVTHSALEKLRAEDRKIDDQRHQENGGKMDAVLKRLDEISPAMVRLGRAEQDILDLRRWKHEKADPYIGAVDVLKARVDEHDRRLER